MGYEQRRAQYRKSVQELNLMDDVFMSRFFDGNVEGATLLVRTILGRDDLEVTQVTTQEELKGLKGRRVRLDILASDGAGRLYNIEVQRDERGADERRAALHSAMLLANKLGPGDRMEDIPEIYVVFITESDVLGLGRPLYRIERMLLGAGGDARGREFDDREHILYVNGEGRNEDTNLGRLMHDFFCRDPRDMHSQVLAERARFFKESEEGVEIMSEVMEKLREEALRERNREVAEKALDRGLAVEATADLLDLAVDEVRKIAEQRKAERAAAGV
jgi:hypothetical protein